MTFEEFKALYDDISWEEEYEFFFSDTDKTYMIRESLDGRIDWIKKTLNKI